MTALTDLISAGGGGVSVPIGGKVDLLDTAPTVTKGSEVFLRDGITTPSSTYPNAPIKSYIANGTLATQNFAETISPWQGAATIYAALGGAMADTGTQELFVVTISGWVNKFNGYGTSFVGSRNLRDGIVFPTTCTADAISSVNFARTGRALGSNMPATDMRAFISGDGGTGGIPAIAYLSDDLQTHYGTFDIASVIGYDWNTSKNQIKAAFVAPLSASTGTQFVVIQPNQTTNSTVYMMRYPVPDFAGGNSSGSLANQHVSTIAYGDHPWGWHPELFPYPTTANNDWVGWIMNDTGSSGQRMYFHDGDGNNVTTSQLSTSYDTTNIPSSSSTSYRAPFTHDSYGLVYTRYGLSNIFSGGYTNLSANRTDFVSSYNTTGYEGYAYKDASTVYVGHSTENKAFTMHPTTRALGASIDMSSQAAPYRFAYHNNVLYNLNGTNIHTYSTTSNAFVSTIDISSKVSGTNAVGIAHDGTNLYVLDGSNSKIHKYNATGSSYVSFVTLSDTPHTSSTLESIAIDSTKNVFFVTHGTTCALYALDGTAKLSSTSVDWKDTDVHDGHIVGLRAGGSSLSKTATVDVVGNPTGSITSPTTNYYRVA